MSHFSILISDDFIPELIEFFQTNKPSINLINSFIWQLSRIDKLSEIIKNLLGVQVVKKSITLFLSHKLAHIHFLAVFKV